MKQMICPTHNKPQAAGKFCLDCGQPLVERITYGVKFKQMSSLKSPDNIKKDIRSWLARLGVRNPDIQIENEGIAASVRYKLLQQTYTLRSVLQKDFRQNLAAIEQLLHFRVLGIERGIETADQAFAGYQALPAPASLETASDKELRDLLMRHHPDTGDGNVDEFLKIKSEIDRRS